MAAAFGEFAWVPENQALESLVYFTIGTGIGAGVLINGKLVHGLTSSEAGHIRPPHDWQKDPFRESVPSMAIVSKAWPTVRPLPGAGARQPRRSLKITLPGIWKRPTSPMPSPQSSNLISPQRIVLAAA